MLEADRGIERFEAAVPPTCITECCRHDCRIFFHPHVQHVPVSLMGIWHMAHVLSEVSPILSHPIVVIKQQNVIDKRTAATELLCWRITRLVTLVHSKFYVCGHGLRKLHGRHGPIEPTTVPGTLIRMCDPKHVQIPRVSNVQNMPRPAKDY